MHVSALELNDDWLRVFAEMLAWSRAHDRFAALVRGPRHQYRFDSKPATSSSTTTTACSIHAPASAVRAG